MMRKLALATAAALIVAGLGTGPAAADGDRKHRYHGHHHDTYRTGHFKRAKPVTFVSTDVRRRYSDETIPLRRLLDIDSSYRGYQVQSVTVKVRPHRSRGRLSLIANGYVVDRAWSHDDRRIRLKPGDERTLGRDLGRLQLDVHGSAFIDSVEVKLHSPRRTGANQPIGKSGNDRHTEIADQVVRIILEQIEVARIR